MINDSTMLSLFGLLFVFFTVISIFDLSEILEEMSDNNG